MGTAKALSPAPFRLSCPSSRVPRRGCGSPGAESAGAGLVGAASRRARGSLAAGLHGGRQVLPADGLRQALVHRRRQRRLNDPGHAARRAGDARLRLPPLVPRDGGPWAPRDPHLYHPAALLLHGACRLQQGSPGRPSLSRPGRLDPGGAVLDRAKPVCARRALRLPPRDRRRREGGARRAAPVAAPRHGLGHVDRGPEPLALCVLARRGVGSRGHEGDRQEERRRAALSRHVLLSDRGSVAQRKLAGRSARPLRL